MTRRAAVIAAGLTYGAVTFATLPLRSAWYAVGTARELPAALDSLVQDLNDSLEEMHDAYRT